MSDVDDSIIDQCRASCDSVSSVHELDQVKAKFLGQKSKIRSSLKSLGTLPKDQRVRKSAELNEIRDALGKIFYEKKNSLYAAAAEQALQEQAIDTTLDAQCWFRGAEHPLSKTINEVKSILYRIGFDIAYGPEVESFYYNFTALNTPRHHPAVTVQDTLYINKDQLLRSHTSCVQVRMMKLHKPPLRIFSPGRVFRADTPDATHSPCFNQCEGLVIDKDLSLKDLIATLRYVLESFFGQHLKLRFRPSYFPFTEPSLECDIWFEDRWLEVLGCGMVHPNVLVNVAVDNHVYRGFAFGLGIDRLAMLRYKISDIRTLYEGDLAFLRQHKDDFL